MNIPRFGRSFLFASFLLFSSALCAVAQTTDGAADTDTALSARENSARRGYMALLGTANINIADLDEPNGVLDASGYPEFEEIAADPLRSVGIDMLAYPGLSNLFFSGSFRLLSSRSEGVTGQADYEGLYFSFGSGWSGDLLPRLRASAGMETNFGLLNAELRSGNSDSDRFNTDFESAIAEGQEDSTLRTLTITQVALAPVARLQWTALTWKKEGKPGGSLEFMLSFRYNIPIISHMQADGVRVNAPSFNFSQMVIGFGVGVGIEL